MNYKLSFFLSFILGLVFFNIAKAEEYRPEMLRNRYEIQLSNTDRGTIYMSEDHTFTIIPNFTNKDYVHICWGSWAFNEKHQFLELSNAELCQVMNGNYSLTKTEYGLVLKEQGKILVFNYLIRPQNVSKK